jgi:glycosyltransferase domain-containing protein
MDLRDVTVVSMSRGREHELQKTIEYWAEVEISVLVLHNTQNPLKFSKILPNLNYVVAEVPYGDRCGLVEQHLKTNYAILCSDDEVYIPSALARMKAILDENPELESVGGLTVAVGNYGPITTGNFTYSRMRQYSNQETTPQGRLNYHFREGSGYKNGAIYRLMRKELMQETMNLFHQVSPFSTPYIFEVTGEIFVNSRGRSIYIDEVYWLRNWINEPVGHKNWDRKLYYKDWSTLEKYKQQYIQWISILENSCGVKRGEFEAILRKVNKLRVESELHEIEGNKRRRVALPEHTKWLIRSIFRPNTLPKSLRETLDDLEKFGISVDKSAIMRALPALY